MKRINLARWFFAAAAIAVAAECSDTSEPEMVEPEISINVTETAFSSENPSEVSVDVSSNVEWKAVATEDWISISPSEGTGNGTVSIAVQENVAPEGESAAARKGAVIISVGRKEVKVNVSQSAEPIVFQADGKTSVEIPADGGEVEVSVSTNIGYVAESDVKWISLVSTRAVKSESLVFSVKLNDRLDPREGTISITSANGDMFRVSVRQEASEMSGNVSSAEEFMSFLAKAPAMDSETVVTLLEDIDLTGKTFEQASVFGATLDGGGHAIKGLSLERGLFGKITGKIKDIVLDGTWSLAPDITVFGALADTLSGAVLEKVSNRGALTCDAASIESKAHSVGMIAGVMLNSTVSGCSNSGSFRYVSGTETSAGTEYASFGGLFGYAEGSVLSGLSNSGKIVLEVSGGVEGANLAFGGVAGRVKDCELKEEISNSGEVSCTVTGVGKKWAFTSGIVGRAEGTALDGCVNTGSVTVSAEQYGNSFRAAGVVALTDAVVSDCRNEGNVTMSFSGTYADCCGVVGRTDNNADVTGCSNSGAVEFVCGKLTGQYSYVAGVAGYVKGSGSKCTNGGTVTVTAESARSLNIGGALGQSVKVCTDCTNDASVNVKFVKMESATSNIGGAVGCLQAGGSGIVNNGALLFDIDDAGTQNPNVGGVVGSGNATAVIKDSHNRASVTVKSSGTVNTVCAGGVNGYHGSNLKFESCTNEAPIIIDVKTVKNTLRVSGISGGNTNFGVAAGCVNEKGGKISVSFDTAQQIYVGGVSAVTQGTDASDAVNKADIEVTGNRAGANGKLYVEVGGVTGKCYCAANAKFTIARYSNSGNVTVNIGTLLGTGYVGGVAGSATTLDTRHYSLVDCTNTGTVHCQNATVADLYTDVATN